MWKPLSAVSRLTWVLALCSQPVLASDPATSSAAIAWLKSIADSTKTHLETAKDTLTVSKYLSEYEAIRFAKDLAGTGREIRELASDFADVQRMYEKVTKHPYQQINNLKGEMEILKRKAGKLGEGDVINEMDDFGALLARSDRFAMVREAINRAERKKRMGQTETEAIRGTEANTALMTEILLGQEEARLLKEAKSAKRAEEMKSVRIHTAPAFGRVKDD